VIVEVALSVVLLIGAGLTIRTFLALHQTDTGLRADNVLIIGVPLSAAKYPTREQRNLFAGQLLERASGLPGVQAATIGNGGAPFGGPQSPVAIVGQPDTEQRRITINLVGPEHLRAFGIPLRGGRMFEPAEVRRGDRLALINEAAARFWPAGENPVGARMRLGLLERAPEPGVVDTTLPPEVTIIGMVANTRNAGLREEPVPAILMPYTVIAPLYRMLVLRTTGDPLLLLNPLREQVRGLDSEQPLGRPFTLDEVIGQHVVQPRFTMALFGVFGALGAALAAAGIYSVLSFHVAQRTQELGVRMALGAPRRHVLALVLTMGGRLVGAGLVVGVLVSLWSTRLLRSQLFGVTPGDPLAYVIVASVLALVALVACYFPARRAAAVDPLAAVRHE
jgi:putative ABC transport system permease protein